MWRSIPGVPAGSGATPQALAVDWAETRLLRRHLPRLQEDRWVGVTAGVESVTHHLVYAGKLPRVNVQAAHWSLRWRLKQACLKQWGVWPFPATQKAHVTITRVLGPRERLMDEVENLRWACKGLTDALKNRRPREDARRGYNGGGNYIIDDSPRYSTFSFLQDETRRELGPRVEIDIRYDLEENNDATS